MTSDGSEIEARIVLLQKQLQQKKMEMKQMEARKRKELLRKREEELKEKLLVSASNIVRIRMTVFTNVSAWVWFKEIFDFYSLILSKYYMTIC